MTRRRKAAIVTILSVTGFVAIATILEIGARIFGFEARSVRRHSWLRKHDPEIGWVYRPESKFQFATSRGVIRASTDGDGFRPVVANAGSDAPIVQCLGDSFTFGAESPDDGTWPECLARAMTDRGRPVRALNRGVTGYNSLQTLIGLRRALERVPKIQAVVYLACFNDPVENFEKDRPHFDVPPRILPPGPSHPERMRTPVRWLRDSSAFINAVRPERAEVSDEAFRKGARDMSGYFTPMFEKFLATESMRDGMRFALREIKKECDARGLPLLVAFCVVSALDDPVARREFADLAGWSPAQTEERLAAYHASFELVRKWVEEAGAEFVDLRGSLAGLSFRDAVAASDDLHFSSTANERVGRAIADRLVK